MIRLCRSAVELAARRGSEVVAAMSDSNAREELAAGVKGKCALGPFLVYFGD
jgi:Cdc6-like AAA superfamily ATPase